MPEIIDERLVHLARNALLVAGMEMGKEGDHWPVIKANINAMMNDYEQLKIEIAVQEELRQHMGNLIAQYEKLLTECDAETKEKIGGHIREMREVHEAMFSPVDPANEVKTIDLPDETEGYAPWKSSAAIIKQLLTEDTADGRQ
ncbi:MAG: hypothetical protein WBK91_10695 [Alphaproteobacteria bacterium]